MTSLALDAIRVAYGVVWHAGGIPEPGRLVIGPDSLRLMDYDAGRLVAELAFDDLRALRFPPSPRGRRAIVLESRRGEWVEIESAAERGIVPDLLEGVASYLLSAAPPHPRLLVSIRFRPGGLHRALELLCGDPPFSTVPSTVEYVFILDDELLLLFATDHPEASTRTRQLWDNLQELQEYIVEIGIGEHAYSRVEGPTDRTGGE